MSQTIFILEGGEMVAFTPADWIFIVDEKKEREGYYEPKWEMRLSEKGDTYEGALTQMMPPLVKVR